MTDIVQSTYGHIASQIDVQGVYPTPAARIQTSGKIDLIAFALTPYQIQDWALRMASHPDTLEFCFAFDSFCKENQGTTLDSALIVFHCRVDRPCQIGVLEYSWNDGQPVAKPIDWQNPFWTNAYVRLAAELTQRMVRGSEVPCMKLST